MWTMETIIIRIASPYTTLLKGVIVSQFFSTLFIQQTAVQNMLVFSQKESLQSYDVIVER